ncbi:MAG: molybdenum cofactor biosynthesis protein MoaE [Opitutaceae bacterium]|nr:molybdenum cofactor biosynthesis protein MoaE [Opitutaceae bacterium]
MFRLSSVPLNPEALQRELYETRAGGSVSFEGRVRSRNEGREVRCLEYEAYGELAEKEGTRIVAEAWEKFAILSARCVHRVGRLQIGEIAVWAGVTAEHRAAAFAACRYIIDEMKKRVPIWKKEHYAGGSMEWIQPPAAGPNDPGPGRKT